MSALMLAIVLLAGTSSVGPTAAAETAEEPIAASNAVVVDADTGEVLYERGMDESIAPASLTKIFTAIVALESAKPDTELTVEPYDLVGEASIGLHAGEQPTLETLLYGLMLTSGNDAAMTIARELGSLPGDSPQESVSRFVERMNTTATRLGLTNTTLQNPHGLDQAGHEASAADIAAMSIYALRNPLFRATISTPYHAGDGREFYNVNRLMDSYPGLIGGKTGVTTDAGYCLMQVAERDGKTVLTVLLGSTEQDWYYDAMYLLDRGFEELEENPDDESRPVVGLARHSTFDVPEVDGEANVGGGLSVNRVSDQEAVVRSNSPASTDEASGWRWPLVSLAMMGVAAVVALNLPLILGVGALAVDRGSRIRLSPSAVPSAANVLRSVVARFTSGRSRRPEARDRHSRQSEAPRRERHRPSDGVAWEPRSGGQVVTHETSSPAVSPARSRAEHAIKLSMQSRYHAAADEFLKALELDSGVDLTKCPGFWRMQPMGYIAAAKAYQRNGQGEDGRRLLTVVQLAFKSNRELSTLFGRAIRLLDD